MTKVVSLNKNLDLTVWGTVWSKLFDNLSNEYTSATITALDKSGSNTLAFTLIQGIPVEIKFIFNDINPSATSISLFQPLFTASGVSGDIILEFTDIDF